MQVKKFEAKSMKEAIDMVKHHLGPEAIILSAKDNSQKFGLMGDKSVEITAAVSERTLQKRQMAEAKLKKEEREKFRQKSARAQKKFIEKVYDKNVKAHARNLDLRSRRYIDIPDDEEFVQAVNERPASRVPIQSASARAGRQATSQPTHRKLTLAQQLPQQTPANGVEQKQVAALHGEIERLQQVIQQFQKVPQTFVSSHPGAEKGVDYEFSTIFQEMRSSGIQEDLILNMIDEAKASMQKDHIKNPHLIKAWMAKKILASTKVTDNPWRGQIHVFVGGSGNGKTSSLVKVVSHLVVKERKKVALLTADSFKVGAADQLKIFSQILNIPFAVIQPGVDWNYLLKQLSDYDHILIDFPAVMMKNVKEIELAQSLMPPKEIEKRVHFVASTTSKDQDVLELARRYQMFHLSDVIFTGLDEATQHGLIYNFQAKTGLPLHSFGTGPRIPEDFEMASRERVVDLIFKLTKIRNNRNENMPEQRRENIQYA